jgi:hypothetical protein
MISNPSGDDITNRNLLSGRAGWRFIKDYVTPLGYDLADFGVCSVIRCHPPGGQFPIGVDGKGATQACRYYDKEIMAKFAPNCFIITQALRDTYKEPAFCSLLRRDIQKAFEFTARGLRPIVCMGNEASSLVASYIIGAGGAKGWRGHWEELPEGWPHLSVPEVRESKTTRGFAAAIKKWSK